MFRTLDQMAPAEAPRFGGKAFNCARLKQAGFPVPDGVAIPAGLAEADAQLVAETAWLRSQPADARFAVRSSGLGEDSEGHSFAGIHETRLNVGRAELAGAVLACLRSAGAARARAYRAERGLDDDGGSGGIGILVQRMVEASTSGVAFTINPITGAGEVVINAAWGLGEALVSGQIDPDEFRVRKSDGRVVSSRLGSKGGDARATPSLTVPQLEALAATLQRIERHYGAPQDVEWCHDGRQFWIVQSRPITVRPAPNLGETEWTRANLAEVLPDQTSPQALFAYEDLLRRAEGRFMGKLLAPESELGPITKVFHGRMYFNLSQFRRVCRLGGAPPAHLLRSFGHTDAIRPEDEIGGRPTLRELLQCLPDFVRIATCQARMATLVRRHEVRTAEALARISEVDPRSLPDTTIWDTLQWWWGIGPDHIQIIFIVGSVMIREASVKKACDAVGFPYERLVYPQLAAGARSVSTQQAIDLVALAEVARHEEAASTYLRNDDGTFAHFRDSLRGTAFLLALDRFLARYGHRGRYESDWAIPRLHENPTPLLFAIRGHLQGPPHDLAAVAERQTAEAAAAWRAFTSHVTWPQRLTLLPRLRAAIRKLKQQYVWREQVRSDLTRVVARLRPWHLALADRFVEHGWLDARDEYFLLHLDEIGAAIADAGMGPGLRAIAASRAAELAWQRPLQMPLLMRESELPMLVRQAHVTSGGDGDELTGQCVSPGWVVGEVVVMRDPGEFAKMKRGAILVAPATDPSWTPLFTLASGVIVEVGGMLSHASTIAREYGLPALANVKDATRVLSTGDRITLDASGGRVLRSSRASR